MLDVKDDNFVAVLPNSAVKGHGRRRASRYLEQGSCYRYPTII